MCTRSKQTNVILVILFFILFQLFSWVVFSTFNQPEEEQEGSMPSEKRRCNKNEFACQMNGTDTQLVCITRANYCNGVKDCPLGEDEDENHCEHYTRYQDLFETPDSRKETTAPKVEIISNETAISSPDLIINSTTSPTIIQFESDSTAAPDLNQTTPSKSSKKKDGNFYSCFLQPCNMTDERKVCCDNQDLQVLPKSFKSTVKMLQLHQNNITNVDKNLFRNLSSLLVVTMWENKIEVLDKDLFSSAYRLKRIFLGVNRLTTIPDELFSNLTNLQFLDLRENQIIDLNLNVFAPLKTLFILNLSNNKLTLEGQAFPASKSLQTLNLAHNNIERITEATFRNLPNLTVLELTANKIVRLSPNSFDHNTKMRHFFLAYNQIPDSQISPTLLRPFKLLRSVELSYNPFHYLPVDIFAGKTDLKSIKLEGLTIYNISIEHFTNLNSLEYLYFSHFRYCMYTPLVKLCRPFTDKASSLKNLIALPSLKVLVWSVSVLIILLNFMVLFLRSVKNPEQLVLSTYVKLLSVSDSLIGFYMLAIAYFDYKMENVYHKYALEFSNSWQCTGLGVLAVFSKQFSLFIVLIISFDRNRSITRFYFERRAIYSFILITAGFIISLFIALFPVLFWSHLNKTNVYFNANMLCYPLHLTEPWLLGWQFNALINFINLPIVSIIIFLYAHMYFKVKNNRKTSRPVNLNVSKTNISNTQEQPLNGSSHLYAYPESAAKSTSPNATLMDKNNALTSNHREDRALAIRLFFIVATDCMCWLPVIFTKIIALFDFKIPASLNAWIIIVIVPFNSVLNPVIYTIAAPKSLSELFRSSYNLVKKKLMAIFKIKSTKCASITRKGSESRDQRTSSGLHQNMLNSSQVTMQCLDRKSSNEQEKFDFTFHVSYLDCNLDYNNNNENLLINQSLLRSSVATTV